MLSYCTLAQIKDPEEVTNKMYGCNIDIKVILSGSLICARVVKYHIYCAGTIACSEKYVGILVPAVSLLGLTEVLTYRYFLPRAALSFLCRSIRNGFFVVDWGRGWG